MRDDEFEWDDEKAESNLAKHGVAFEAGRRVFDDAFAFTCLDPVSGSYDVRHLITGIVSGVLMTVVYTEREDRTRIISARKATKYEQREYYKGQTAE